MCVGGLLKPPKPRPPAPLPEDASVLAQRKRLREEQSRQIEADKQKTFEMRLAAYTDRAGKRSLLTGRKGGQGFQIEQGLMTKDTLGN
jgi:hypothetical protein|tara:strand:- start:242 stop:505 length:264 start_codon:yes stop_codon:yes gene_type:complete